MNSVLAIWFGYSLYTVIGSFVLCHLVLNRTLLNTKKLPMISKHDGDSAILNEFNIFWFFLYKTINGTFSWQTRTHVVNISLHIIKNEFPICIPVLRIDNVGNRVTCNSPFRLKTKFLQPSYSMRQNCGPKKKLQF